MPENDSFPTLDGETVPVRTAASSNGHALSAVRHETELFSRTEERRREFAGESSRRENELNDLREMRHKARIELSARLGDFGLIYEPETNSLQRPIVADPPPPAPAEMRQVPEPFDPTRYGLPSQEPKAFAPKLLKGLDIMFWIAVPFLGAFVGYSIAKLVGLRVDASLAYAVVAVLFGAALLAAMKGAVYAIFHHAMRHATARGERAPFVFASIVAGLLIAAEAGLGTVAIHRYSVDRSVAPEDVIPMWQAALIALCFSTPILLTSAFKGWADGREHRDLDDVARADLERYHREKSEAQREHETAHQRRSEEAMRKHDEAVARFEAANERYHDDPRWRTAMSLFGAIATYDIEIAERERLLVEYKGRSAAVRAS